MAEKKNVHDEIQKIIDYVGTHKDMPTRGVNKWDIFFEYEDAYKKETGNKVLSDGNFAKWLKQKQAEADKQQQAQAEKAKRTAQTKAQPTTTRTKQEVEKDLSAKKEELATARKKMKEADAKAQKAYKKLQEFKKKYPNVTEPGTFTTVYNDKLYKEREALRADLAAANAERKALAKEIGRLKTEINHLNIEQNGAKEVARNDGKRAEARKAELKRIEKMQAAARKKAEELGKDVKVEDLVDKKGNHIFTFQDKEGKYIGIMTAKKGQALSDYIDASKSQELQALCQDAKNMNKNKKNDLGKMIDIIGNRAALEAELAQGRTTPEKPKPINVSEMPKMNIVQTPDTKDVKLKITPTVTLVPHIKHNGKPSKRNFDIQLMDADGKVFTLTKKMVEKAVKQQGNTAATRGEMVDFAWDNYVEAAKKGQLQPETVASFFKGQANMGAENASKNPKLAGAEHALDIKLKAPEAKVPVSVILQQKKQNG